MELYTTHFLCNQAHRTAPARQFFYTQANWKTAPISLDLGCGTGVITSELTFSRAQAIGLDINPDLLTQAVMDNLPNNSVHHILADATSLPFRSSVASFVLSHFTLMWIHNRETALAEVKRILRPGSLLAAIEPDYTGRIEIPKDTEYTSHSPIIDYLIFRGADPFIGGKLPFELRSINLTKIQFGTLSWEYNPRAAQTEIREEVALLQGKGIHWKPPVFTYTPIFWIIAFKRKIH
ncbi:MAG: class I SAM-dependent methyltransferase [Promethearchaeota archaeon]